PALVEIALGHLEGRWPNSDPDRGADYLRGLAQEGVPDAASALLDAIVAGTVQADAASISNIIDNAMPGSLKPGSLRAIAELAKAGHLGALEPGAEWAWTQRAAQAGSTGAMLDLHERKLADAQTEADQSTQWLVKAAEGGSVTAAEKLAIAYEIGLGVPVDFAQAKTWRERATQLRSANGQENSQL
ncbi:MAG: hypothetical protein AAF737_01645, partial [Pseudomonadota bacterium]